jgi:hypothetical protein
MSANRHHADRWFTFGLGVVGAATGYLVALSSSPVVGVVLPLVFGLAGGAGGAYIAKADLNSEHGQRRLALIGKSVGALSLAMIVASMLTLLARTETGRQAFIKFPGVEQLNAKSLVTLATLRARLQVLGASEEEQKGILVRAVKVNTAKADEPTTVAKKLHAIADAGAGLLDQLRNPTGLEGQDANTKKKLENLRAWLTGVNPQVHKWATDLDSKSEVPAESINWALQMIDKALGAVIGAADQPSEQLGGFGSNPALVEQLMLLRIRLYAHAPRLQEEKQTELQDISNAFGSDDNDWLNKVISGRPDLLKQPVLKLAIGHRDEP